MAGYLNHDWPLDYTDQWKAVADYVSSEPGSASRLGTEVVWVLDQDVDDDELWRLVVKEIRSGYDPRRAGWSVREWLLEMLRYVDSLGRAAHDGVVDE